MSSRSIAVLRSTDTRAGRGLTAAAVVGWALVAGSLGLLELGPELPKASAVRVYIVVAALFGLPLSLLFCFSVGLLAWQSTARRPWVRRRDAAGAGAVVGIVLALLWVAVTFLPTLSTRISARRGSASATCCRSS